MGLIVVLAVISVASSSLTETRNQGNATSVKIEMHFGQPAKVQLTKAIIRQLSSRVFQIVVDDEHEACQLAKTINPDLSPCIRADERAHERAHEREQSDIIVSRNDTTNQRKPPENKLPPPKTLSRISAKQPPGESHFKQGVQIPPLSIIMPSLLLILTIILNKTCQQFPAPPASQPMMPNLRLKLDATQTPPKKIPTMLFLLFYFKKAPCIRCTCTHTKAPTIQSSSHQQLLLQACTVGSQHARLTQDSAAFGIRTRTTFSTGP
jgi:hypothetical protein